jgi:hypothetical protein
MTTQASIAAGDAAAFVPRGHPVARFVGVLAVVAVVLVAIWATGLFAPRVEVSSSTGALNLLTHVGWTEIDVRNQGLLPARVRRVEVVDRYVRTTGQSLLDVRVRPGRTVHLRVRFAVDCARYEREQAPVLGAIEPRLLLRLHLEGLAGTERVATHDDSYTLSDACGPPPEALPQG